MFDRKKFKIKMVEQERKLQDVAKHLGINAATLWRKMNGESDFTREEIEKSIHYLGIENIAEIFFTDKITDTQQRKD